MIALLIFSVRRRLIPQYHRIPRTAIERILYYMFLVTFIMENELVKKYRQHSNSLVWDLEYIGVAFVVIVLGVLFWESYGSKSVPAEPHVNA